MRRTVRVTVSGSFHRHLEEISSTVKELKARGVEVLSPADPQVVEAKGEFLFVASDIVRSVKLVEDRHLEAIRASDFCWLVTPDGYVGQSASMEIGFAAACRTPILSQSLPADLTLRQYVRQVADLEVALSVFRESPATRQAGNAFLIDPRASIVEAHDVLEDINKHLSDPKTTESFGFSNGVRRLQNYLPSVR